MRYLLLNSELGLALLLVAYGCSNSEPGPMAGVSGGGGASNGGAAGEVAVLAGAAGANVGDGGAAGSAGKTDAAGDGGAEPEDGGAGAGGGTAESTAFTVFVTQSAPGSPAESAWAGVLRFAVTADSAPLVATTGIDKGDLADPISVAYRAASSELFVGNRHGNSPPGSISRFIFDRVSGSVTANGTIVGNGLRAVSQVAFSPTSGEMFAANYYTSGTGPAISRFTFDAAGNAVANGTIGAGSTQGLVVAPDGKRIYATSGGMTDGTIRQYDLSGATTLPSVTVSGAPRLFYMALRNATLYVAAVDANKVFRLTLDAEDDLTLKDGFAADGPASITFSPDAKEMFTAGHQVSDIIDHFAYDAGSDSWIKTTTTDTGVSMGGILAL